MALDTYHFAYECVIFGLVGRMLRANSPGSDWLAKNKTFLWAVLALTIVVLIVDGARFFRM
jgi:hypothetical protein